VIYRRDRFIMTEERVLAAIDAEGLTPSPRGLAEYFKEQPTVAATAPDPAASAIPS